MGPLSHSSQALSTPRKHVHTLGMLVGDDGTKDHPLRKWNEAVRESPEVCHLLCNLRQVTKCLWAPISPFVK